jgi:hypothetical protein
MFGADTYAANGVRFTGPTSDMFHPQSFGQQTTGVPQVSPTMPPYLGAGYGGAVNAQGAAPTGGGGGSVTDGENVDGYGTAGNNATVTQVAADNPLHLKVSPLWWTIGALIVGLILLRLVHWRVEGGASAAA